MYCKKHNVRHMLEMGEECHMCEAEGAIKKWRRKLKHTAIMVLLVIASVVIGIAVGAFTY
jgi:hypothetical protein